ncbi:MAG TPA: 4-hydroxythreonine-4-phosphate dehydrogenase PdxA, partial [Nitrospira sp.]|nr:4-hydroxythreonine-4-phosphate dehydrogenase PdxA [Nitrospira sp.]
MARKRSQHSLRPVLGLTMGDPAGIGPEVIAKALADKALTRLCQPVVIGSRPVMERTIKWLDLPLDVVTFDPASGARVKPGQVAVADPLERPLPKFRLGVASAVTGAASIAFIREAVELAQAGSVGGIVTAPINKEAMNMAG